MRKKKIFLGAFINHNNAQNINCLSIAKHLDKKKYDIKTLLILPSKNIKLISGVSYIPVYKKIFKFSSYLAFCYGLIWSDISYLPKHHSTPKLLLKLSNLFNKKIFTTIEGNMCNLLYKSMIDSFGTKQKMIKYFNHFTEIFGITKHIVANANCGVKLNKRPLFLGVEHFKFDNYRIKTNLNNIIFIGSLIERKRISELLEISKKFRKISFHIVGLGPLKYDLLNISSKNVIFYDNINNNKIKNILKDIDLNILLSYSEGFPKVILETAASSIPSIVYDTYGMHDIIKHDTNGFVLNNKHQVISKINELLKNPELLQKNSNGAYKLSKSYDWKVQIKKWEFEIDKLV